MLERLGDVARPAAFALDVRDLDAVDGQRRTVHLITQADPLLERGDQAEHLERGPGLQSGLSEVEAVGVAAAVVGADGAVVRIDRHHRRAHVGVLAVEVFRHGLLGGLLGLGVDGGGDLKPLGVQRPFVDVEQIHQFSGHLALDEPVGPGRLVLCARLIGRHGLREHLRGTVVRRQRLGLHHAVEHPVPPRQGALGVDGRVQGGGPPNEGRQQCPFRYGELLDRLVEVGLRCRGDAVRAAPEVDDVQIGLQHFVFRPLPRHLGGDDQFLGLAHQAADAVLRRPDEGVLHVLLGDRRSTLQVAAAEEVVVHRPCEAAEVEAGVGIKVAVFGGDHRLADVHGHLVEVDVDPITFRRNDFGDLRAVAGQDGRHLVGAKVPRLGNVDDEVRHREGDDR